MDCRKRTGCEEMGREIDDDDNTLTMRIWSKLDRRLLLVIRVYVRLLPNLIRTQFVNVFYLRLRLEANGIFRGARSLTRFRNTHSTPFEELIDLVISDPLKSRVERNMFVSINV